MGPTMAFDDDRRQARSRSLPQEVVIEVAQRMRSAECERQRVIAPVGQYLDTHPDSFEAAVNYVRITHKAHETYEAEVVEALTEFGELVRRSLSDQTTRGKA